MRIDVVTIFPQMFSGPLDVSLIKRARAAGLAKINIYNLRDFTADRHQTVDDRPYGGGAGMIFKPEPVYRAIKYLSRNRIRPANRRIIYLSPQGRVFNQSMARRLAKYQQLILICGHYEGVDERVLDWVDEEISIGDYVLTGGELPALVLIDCVVRQIPGVVAKKESVQNDSFSQEYLLDWPQYTRPPVYQGRKVPAVLLSGNHQKIEEWRRQEAIRATRKKRPDLYRQWLERKKKC